MYSSPTSYRLGALYTIRYSIKNSNGFLSNFLQGYIVEELEKEENPMSDVQLRDSIDVAADIGFGAVQQESLQDAEFEEKRKVLALLEERLSLLKQLHGTKGNTSATNAITAMDPFISSGVGGGDDGRTVDQRRLASLRERLDLLQEHTGMMGDVGDVAMLQEHTGMMGDVGDVANEEKDAAGGGWDDQQDGNSGMSEQLAHPHTHTQHRHTHTHIHNTQHIHIHTTQNTHTYTHTTHIHTYNTHTWGKLGCKLR